jgi:hypothetical protein
VDSGFRRKIQLIGHLSDLLAHRERAIKTWR